MADSNKGKVRPLLKIVVDKDTGECEYILNKGGNKGNESKNTWTKKLYATMKPVYNEPRQ
jgi:hypothetical protein